MTMPNKKIISSFFVSKWYCMKVSYWNHAIVKYNVYSLLAPRTFKGEIHFWDKCCLRILIKLYYTHCLNSNTPLTISFDILDDWILKDATSVNYDDHSMTERVLRFKLMFLQCYSRFGLALRGRQYIYLFIVVDILCLVIFKMAAY